MITETDLNLGIDSVWEVTWKFAGESFETLKAMAEEQSYTARTNVFQQGDPADGMYLVLDGFALVIASDEHTGDEHTVGIVTAGQSFGELGLLIRQPRTATVAAGTNLRVLKITPEMLVKLESKQPKIAVEMYKQLASTLAEQLLKTGDLLHEHEAA